jgi:membrane fusion protein (multidrug efflux system)
MKIFKIVIFIMIAVVVMIVVFYKFFTSEPAQAVAPSGGLARTTLPVDMIIAKPEPFTETISTIGSVEANEMVMLKTEISGKITGIFFQEGQRVSQGTLLVKVYDDDLQAQLTKARANLQLTEDVEGRQRQLLGREAISQQEYDIAFANLQAAQADVALLLSNISKTEIRAPFDGTIGFRLVAPGEYITPGVDITSLVNNNPARIQFVVPERYSQMVGIGTAITYRLQGHNQERQATVYAVDSKIDINTRTLQMKAFSPNPNGILIPGAMADISVHLKTKQDVIFIPAQAILSESVGQRVYLYSKGAVQSVIVETGTRTNDRVEITSGIAPSDTVIVTGIMQITPRTIVTPLTIL